MVEKNTEAGVVLFDEIVYEQAGVYVYTMADQAGTDEDITYDDTVYTVTVTVEDDENGFLKATVDNQEDAITFTNVVAEIVPSETPEPSETPDPSESPKESEKPSTEPTQKPTATQKPSTTNPQTTKAPTTSGSTTTPKTGDDSNAML